MREEQGVWTKGDAKIFRESYIPLIRKGYFFDLAGMSVDSIRPGGPVLPVGERGHVKSLLVDGIAEFRCVGAGIAVEAATIAAQRTVRAADMRQAGFVGKSGPGISGDWTGLQARFSDT